VINAFRSEVSLDTPIHPQLLPFAVRAKPLQRFRRIEVG
jgi:hypothetical protein